VTTDEMVREIKIAYQTRSVWIDRRLGWVRVTVWQGTECVATCTASTKKEAVQDIYDRRPHGGA
jgi:hypothetical protein